jgi:hypothetical protein
MCDFVGVLLSLRLASLLTALTAPELASTVISESPAGNGTATEAAGELKAE